MQLGIFTKDASTGILSGSIRTLSTTVDHVEIAPSTKRSKESPDFRVYGPTGSDFGAGWNKLSAEGKKYISLVLRDPQFNDGQPLYPILVEGENNEFVMAWEAPDPTKAPSRPAVTPGQAAAAESLDQPALGAGKRKSA
ncbi:MAG: DUF736 domain-containing protein [Hyphomonadaceae bacterium]